MIGWYVFWTRGHQWVWWFSDLNTFRNRFVTWESPFHLFPVLGQSTKGNIAWGNAPSNTAMPPMLNAPKSKRPSLEGEKMAGAVWEHGTVLLPCLDELLCPWCALLLGVPKKNGLVGEFLAWTLRKQAVAIQFQNEPGNVLETDSSKETTIVEMNQCVGAYTGEEVNSHCHLLPHQPECLPWCLRAIWYWTVHCWGDSSWVLLQVGDWTLSEDCFPVNRDCQGWMEQEDPQDVCLYQIHALPWKPEFMFQGTPPSI